MIKGEKEWKEHVINKRVRKSRRACNKLKSEKEEKDTGQ